MAPRRPVAVLLSSSTIDRAVSPGTDRAGTPEERLPLSAHDVAVALRKIVQVNDARTRCKTLDAASPIETGAAAKDEEPS